MEHRELFAGLIRLHVLHHAAKGEIYGQWTMEELGATGIGSVPEPSIRCCTDEDSRPSTMCRQLSLGDAIARMKLNRPGYSRHLIEQPMLGCCSTGPLPASTIWHIASNSSRRASGTGA